MKRHISNEVLCPFYRSEDGYRICCEGMDKLSSIHVVFRTPTDKKGYSAHYCCREYRRCGIARALYAKYGGNGNE